MKVLIETHYLALTSVAQLVGHCPAEREAAGSIPGQGNMPGLQALTQEATNQCFSPSPSPSLPLSLKERQ